MGLFGGAGVHVANMGLFISNFQGKSGSSLRGKRSLRWEGIIKHHKFGSELYSQVELITEWGHFPLLIRANWLRQHNRQ